MKIRPVLSRSASLFLILSLSLPAPAFAMRAESVEGSARVGLEKRLQTPSQPHIDVQQIPTGTLSPTAGLEEKARWEKLHQAIQRADASLARIPRDGGTIPADLQRKIEIIHRALAAKKPDPDEILSALDSALEWFNGISGMAPEIRDALNKTYPHLRAARFLVYRIKMPEQPSWNGYIKPFELEKVLACFFNYTHPVRGRKRDEIPLGTAVNEFRDGAGKSGVSKSILEGLQKEKIDFVIARLSSLFEGGKNLSQEYSMRERELFLWYLSATIASLWKQGRITLKMSREQLQNSILLQETLDPNSPNLMNPNPPLNINKFRPKDERILLGRLLDVLLENPPAAGLEESIPENDKERILRDLRSLSGERWVRAIRVDRQGEYGRQYITGQNSGWTVVKNPKPPQSLLRILNPGLGAAQAELYIQDAGPFLSKEANRADVEYALGKLSILIRIARENSRLGQTDTIFLLEHGTMAAVYPKEMLEPPFITITLRSDNPRARPKSKLVVLRQAELETAAGLEETPTLEERLPVNEILNRVKEILAQKDPKIRVHIRTPYGVNSWYAARPYQEDVLSALIQAAAQGKRAVTLQPYGKIWVVGETSYHQEILSLGDLRSTIYSPVSRGEEDFGFINGKPVYFRLKTGRILRLNSLELLERVGPKMSALDAYEPWCRAMENLFSLNEGEQLSLQNYEEMYVVGPAVDSAGLEEKFSKVLLVTNRPDNQAVWEKVASTQELEIKVCSNLREARKTLEQWSRISFLKKFPGAVVVDLDADEHQEVLSFIEDNVNPDTHEERIPVALSFSQLDPNDNLRALEKSGQVSVFVGGSGGGYSELGAKTVLENLMHVWKLDVGLDGLTGAEAMREISRYVRDARSRQAPLQLIFFSGEDPRSRVGLTGNAATPEAAMGNLQEVLKRGNGLVKIQTKINPFEKESLHITPSTQPPLSTTGLEESGTNSVATTEGRRIRMELEKVYGSMEGLRQFGRGIREAAEVQRQGVAFLFDLSLVRGKDGEENALAKQMRLIDLQGNFEGDLNWLKEVPLTFDLASPEHMKQMLARGYRVIRIAPREGDAGILSDHGILLAAMHAYLAAIQTEEKSGEAFQFFVDTQLYQGFGELDYPTFVVTLQELIRAA